MDKPKNRKRLWQFELEQNADYALMKCFRRGRQLVFFCPFCKKEHAHGAVEAPFEQGHRVPHCTSQMGQMAFPNGYTIFWDGKSTMPEDYFF